MIDLRHGQVVHAVRGQRASYRPVRSQRCEGSDPVEVARALVRHVAATELYVADLDALQGGEVQLDVLQALIAALPGLRLWLDGGWSGPAALQAFWQRLDATTAAALDPVLASEALQDEAALRACLAPGQPWSGRALLSLDRRDGRPLDPAGCWQRPELWPARLVVMTLERVGADLGPDLDTLAEVRRRAPQATLIGAGGLRGPHDLQAAAQAGARAWLVASALHDGRLPATARA